MPNPSLLTAFDIIGTLAFAILGAWEGRRKGLDLLGITVLGLLTAFGGGLVRDALIANTPPLALRSPLHILVSLGGVLLARLAPLVDIRARHGVPPLQAWRRLAPLGAVLQICDAIGLGAFAASGANLAAASGHCNLQTVLFLGTLTAVGGGILRDICVQERPGVFYKEIYATAALAGSFAYYLALPPWGDDAATYLCFAVATGLRLLALRFRWRLPRG